MAAFTPATTADRDDAAAFAGRAARWDNQGPVRLRADGDLVRLWATTPFDTLATRAVTGTLEPRDVTVHAGNLLSALAVVRDGTVDPGPAVDAAWRAQLPPVAGWVAVDTIPAEVIGRLSDDGVARARANPGPAGGAGTALLDSEVMTVQGNGMSVVITMRTLFALSGMGFAPPTRGEVIRISATDAWVRLDARFGAVVRRRHAALPLLFAL
ncbi:hypothetical protein GIS00_05860 [Nakamurella sp. YIM 132087]|uniref:Uncharacterized protein n=1 Tax=Nakamurella alba TaxID=2665158 RepID=A0A7K1FJ53_9ACTN|nr:hypothetical protein [Nakamurella alba]MTD13469.1 hypothetical protein [Nakamurella alba]